jgi:hypothetical protein
MENHRAPAGYPDMSSDYTQRAKKKSDIPRTSVETADPFNCTEEQVGGRTGTCGEKKRRKTYQVRFPNRGAPENVPRAGKRTGCAFRRRKTNAGKRTNAGKHTR